MIAAKLPRLWLAPSLRPGLPRRTPLRLWHVAIVVIAAAGVLAGRNRLMLATLVTFTLFHLVVEAIPRYALPALPTLFAAGCAGLGYVERCSASSTNGIQRRRIGQRVRVPPPARPASPSVSA